MLPTDTVYGIGADAFDSDAVAALLSAKGRGRDMPVPVLVGSWHTIDGLVYSVPHTARELIRAFWPGALSLVVRQAPSLQWDLGDAARHGDAAHAAAPGGHRTAARGGPDGGVEREHLRPARRRHRRGRAATNSATSSRCISTPGRPSSRRRRRSSTSPARIRGSCGEGPVTVEAIAEVLGVEAASADGVILIGCQSSTVHDGIRGRQ